MNWKNFFNLFFILIISLICLEVFSLVLFNFLSKKSLSYSVLQKDRSLRISVIQEKLQGRQDAAGIKGLYQFHPYIGYIGRPGEFPWKKNPQSFNEYGMLSVPGHSYPSYKRGGDFVVAVLGGSVAEIFANTMEEDLNKYLRDSYGFKQRLVLISLATGGYKEPQQLFHLQYALLSGFEFDAVLNIDGFNDLVLASQNIDSGINPLYPSGYHIGGLSKLMSGSLDFQTARDVILYHDLNRREQRLLSLISRFPFRYSPFLNLLGELWSVRTDGKIRILQYEMAVKAQETMTDEFRGPSFKKDNKYESAAGIWKEASEMLYALCQSKGIVYVHVLQPNQYVAGSKPLTENEKKIAINPMNSWGKSAREGYPFLISKGKDIKARGVPFYDLSMIFRNVKEDIYTDDCCHFAKEGNEIMGREIADILMRETKMQGHGK